MLGAIRMARAPEPNKRTLKASIAAELCSAIRQAPGLKRVKVADGVDDNWSFLAEEGGGARWCRGPRLLPRRRTPARYSGGGIWRGHDQDPAQYEEL
jgi:hypothetical protein